MERERILAGTRRLLELAEAPGAKRLLRSLRSRGHPKAWLLVYEAFGGEGNSERLALLGSLVGRFRHAPGLHPARALRLAEKEALLERILRAEEGLEVGELLGRAESKVEGMDLVEVALALWYWNPRMAVAWAKAAHAAPKGNGNGEKENGLSLKEAKEEA